MDLTFEMAFRKAVDGSVGVKTSVGIAGQVSPRRSVSDEEAHRLPAESETPGMKINTPF